MMSLLFYYCQIQARRSNSKNRQIFLPKEHPHFNLSSASIIIAYPYLFENNSMSQPNAKFRNQAISFQQEKANVVYTESSHSQSGGNSWQDELLQACKRRRQMTQEGIRRAVDIIEFVLQENRTPVGHYLLAEAYLYLQPADNRQKIIKAYREAISLSPKFQEAYRQLGTFLFKTGLYREALKVYLEWGNHFPKRGEIWSRIGDIYTELKETVQAGKFFMLAVSRGRKDRIDREQFTLQDEEDMIIDAE